MLNEPASSFDDDYPRSSRTLPIDDEGPSSETRYSEIHRAVESVLAIEEKSFTFSDKEKIRARREDLAGDKRFGGQAQVGLNRDALQVPGDAGELGRLKSD